MAHAQARKPKTYRLKYDPATRCVRCTWSFRSTTNPTRSNRACDELSMRASAKDGGNNL